MIYDIGYKTLGRFWRVKRMPYVIHMGLNYLSHCSSGPQYELICIQPIRDRAYSFDIQPGPP